MTFARHRRIYKYRHGAEKVKVFPKKNRHSAGTANAFRECRVDGRDRPAAVTTA
jgi:hypothetical protein